METTKLKKFAQNARRSLIEQVQAKLGVVLAAGSAERREYPKAIEQLENKRASLGEGQLIEMVAYTWFNRLGALRFMDANGYNRIRIVSSAEGRSQPEILSEALGGYIDTEIVPASITTKVSALLDGSAPSRDPQGEAYRLLLVAACNYWHKAMPYLFEAIADYTELLMPEGLLAPDSILAELRNVMTEDACQDVEIIGWLYQFYISEKKDQVFAGLKKNQKITAENIPAATQLFTPHWIVRYLVENSLGRLWLLNNPHSGLAAKMDYYIAPEEPETDFLKITKPEEIRICDPAAGSGHMLTYAFDLLYAIYEEEGYDPTEIPALILTHNLTGVEIDDRAGALAAFALAMKAAAKLGRRRFLRMEAKPDICVLQNVSFTEAEVVRDVAAVVGKDLFTDELRETLGQFEQAKNFGSLIVPKLRDPAETLRVVAARDFGGDLLLKEVQERVVAVLRMAEALSPKYHVVVANPPYMSASNMTPTAKQWVAKNFPTAKSDLMTCFMARSQVLSVKSGYWSMINLPSWMFLSSFEKLREQLLNKQTINSLLHLGRGIFGSDFGSTAFCLKNDLPHETSTGVYRRLFTKHVDVRKPDEIERLFLSASEGLYVKEQSFLKTVPGWPLAYWLSPDATKAFLDGKNLQEIATTRKGMVTANNDIFVRAWQEVSKLKLNTFSETREAASDSGCKWFPYIMGGEFRKWFGNRENVVNWLSDGNEIRTKRHPTEDRIWATNFNLDYIFGANVNWNSITSGALSFRYSPGGELFASTGLACFAENKEREIAAFLNSATSKYFLSIIAPTMSANPGDIGRLPLYGDWMQTVGSNSGGCIEIARADWDAYETSWDFTTLPLLSPDHRGETLADSYITLRTHWQSMTDEMKALEEENNRIFIDAYGLQDELTPEVPIEEITLTCNPAYRYGVKGTEADRETRLRADTMAEFLSYAVGCMFGRYSLDAPGLILANQGETLEDYLARIPQPSYMPDEDNVIPVLDADWFPDDITERFRLFLRTTFGEEKFAENLRYIEEALGKDIRKYFTKDFYADHVKRYKKRPIYWMFSSPKGTFNALIYMHRYRADTISVILNDYLREFRSKLNAERGQMEHQVVSGTPSEQTRAQKRIDSIARIVEELDDYERDIVYPLATERLEIDLDDGVKVNYAKLGKALKPIKGLNA